MTNATHARPANINVTAAVEAANLVKTTCDALSERRAALGIELRMLDKQLAKLWNAPLTREEAKQLVLNSVDLFAAEFPSSLNGSGLFDAFVKPKGQREPYAVNGMTSIRSHDGLLSLADLDRIQRLGTAPGARTVFGIEQLGLLGKGDTKTIEAAFCFFFGDHVKQLLESRFNATVSEHSFPKEAGTALSVAERRAEIDSIGERVAAINAELSRIDVQLIELTPAKSSR